MSNLRIPTGSPVNNASTLQEPRRITGSEPTPQTTPNPGAFRTQPSGVSTGPQMQSDLQQALSTSNVLKQLEKNMLMLQLPDILPAMGGQHQAFGISNATVAQAQALRELTTTRTVPDLASLQQIDHPEAQNIWESIELMSHFQIRATKKESGQATTPNTIGNMLASVRSGGAFTSKKDQNGQIDHTLTAENLLTLSTRVSKFYQFTDKLRTEQASNGLCSEGMSDTKMKIYRKVNSQSLSQLQVGQSVNELLPTSTTWSKDFAMGWSSQNAGEVVLEIHAPLNYPMVIMSYPPGHKPARDDLKPMNQDQQEITFAPSRFEVIGRTVEDGKTILKVKPTPLPENEVQDAIELARLKNRGPFQPPYMPSKVKQVYQQNQLQITQTYNQIDWTAHPHALHMLTAKLGKGIPIQDLQQSIIFPT